MLSVIKKNSITLQDLLQDMLEKHKIPRKV